MAQIKNRKRNQPQAEYRPCHSVRSVIALSLIARL